LEDRSFTHAENDFEINHILRDIEMNTISLQDLHLRAQSLGPKEKILDVRTIEEYSHGHIPGSLHVPLGELTQHVEKLATYEILYIHCMHGVRAQRAYQVLTQSGLSNVCVLADSGFYEWTMQGFPVDTLN
jgi:rhodanese-related sulfurtransferase